MVSTMETEEGASGMLVTAVDVVDAANDNAMLVPMLEQAEETTGTKPQMTLADAGYFAASHVAECATGYENPTRPIMAVATKLRPEPRHHSSADGSGEASAATIKASCGLQWSLASSSTPSSDTSRFCWSTRMTRSALPTVTR